MTVHGIYYGTGTFTSQGWLTSTNRRSCAECVAQWFMRTGGHERTCTFFPNHRQHIAALQEVVSAIRLAGFCAVLEDRCSFSGTSLVSSFSLIMSTASPTRSLCPLNISAMHLYYSLYPLTSPSAITRLSHHKTPTYIFLSLHLALLFFSFSSAWKKEKGV